MTILVTKMKLQFGFEASPKDEKSNVIAITSIMTEDGTRYVIPKELMYTSAHEELKKTESYTKLTATLKRRHQKKKLWIIMTKELKKEYMDEAGNIQVNNQYLDEIEENEKQSEKGKTDLTKILEKLVESTQKREDEKNLKHIAEKFIIEKFTSKNANAKQWLEIFEKECTRFNINKDETKIETLRLFLDESCLNWYNAMRIKEDVKGEWLEWKEKFLETFADRGWNRITYAHLFRYKEGTLIDYVMKKERLLLEVNKSIDPIALIHMIAVGLPG